MSGTNITTKKKKIQRIRLKFNSYWAKSKYRKRLFNSSYIANYLKVHKSTISKKFKNKIKSIVKQIILLASLTRLLMFIMIIYLKEIYSKVNNIANVQKWQIFFLKFFYY